MLLLLLHVLMIGGGLAVSKLLFLVTIVAIAGVVFFQPVRTRRTVLGLADSTGTHS
jgi:hypothetical protein